MNMNEINGYDVSNESDLVIENSNDEDMDDEDEQEEEPAPRKRGRPKKTVEASAVSVATSKPAKKSGPKKATMIQEEPPIRRRGRPPKSAQVIEVEPPKPKRTRQPKVEVVQVKVNRTQKSNGNGSSKRIPSLILKANIPWFEGWSEANKQSMKATNKQLTDTVKEVCEDYSDLQFVFEPTPRLAAPFELVFKGDHPKQSKILSSVKRAVKQML
jgi:hypothetical protein